ncbi:Stp1/IreP family PP2C-type Ser/Thr phosphatase [Bacillus sp. DJP31]|uniref:Stp1/IreP family PP2C-type Ser/Thr phosphatase n=1 Tax=Bacillus sp. DJP31 TaxID=3409789 RepID=UPI003BB505FD
MVGTFFLTDRGRVRQHNEDNGGTYYNKGNQLLAIVADGMGGHRAGDVASSMAIGAFEEYWSKTETLRTSDEAEKWLEKHVKLVNEQVFKHAKVNTECDGMGTTLVLSVCIQGFITLAHIGDSRCYIIEKGEILIATEDHSLVNELVRSGQISKEDAEYHPRKNVLLRALGTDLSVQVDIKTLTNDDFDYILLCSDGLSNKISSEEIVNALQENVSLEEKGKALVARANENGGEDNITLVLIDFSNVQPESGER